MNFQKITDRVKKTARVAVRYRNMLFFTVGFLFDALTTRIDSLTDQALQLVYLALLTLLLVLQVRQNQNRWSPQGKIASLWRYHVEVVHFLYGGLLSVYTVLYFESGHGYQTLVFLSALVALMVFNEMPQARRLGYRLRLSLYAFFLCSYAIYMIPILVGKINNGVFIISLLIAGGLLWWMSGLLARPMDSLRERMGFFLPGAGVVALIAGLYFFKLIPPVPLSVQEEGIYHGVSKENGAYVLKTPRPPWYAFWRLDSRPFMARDEDRLYHFVQVFAPKGFEHKALVRWERFDAAKDAFVETETFDLDIVGGRRGGFRGYSHKGLYEPGRWRVTTETLDGRILGRVAFDVRRDDSQKPRRWKTLRR